MLFSSYGRQLDYRMLFILSVLLMHNPSTFFRNHAQQRA